MYQDDVIYVFEELTINTTIKKVETEHSSDPLVNVGIAG